MAWGVLDDTKLAEVPGTTLLDRKDDSSMMNKEISPKLMLINANNKISAQNTQDAFLKKKNGVILIPQPSDSPNDPYNW